MPRHGPRSGTSDRDYLKDRAHHLVFCAMRDGQLPRLSAVEIKCTDCPERATEWDHRDYRKPLEVYPVCHACNLARGPGLPEITDKDELRYKHDLANSGHRWDDKVQGGEGWTPLERFCHISLDDTDRGATEHLRALGMWNDSLGSAEWFRGGINRWDYFKRHDPWRLA